MSWLRELRIIARLSLPAIVTQIGTLLLGVVDLVMVGHVSVESLASLSLGHVWVMGCLIIGMGILFGMDPIVTQAHGAKDSRQMGLTLQRGVLLALVSSIPIAGLWLLTEKGLLLLGQDPTLARTAHQYVLVQIPGIPAFLVFTVLRQYLQGRTIVMPAMWIILIANGVNAFLNWVLIFGHLGFEPMGVVGAGYATTVTRFLVLAALATWIVKGRLHEGAWEGWSRRALSLSGLLPIFRFGLPVGIQLALELWAFQAATLMAGQLSQLDLASHTIVLNLASLSFMMPLGIALGATTRVGNLIGQRNPLGAQVAAWSAMSLGAGVMLLSAVVFTVFRFFLPSLYTGDLEVIHLSAAVLPVAATFQLFDGVQVVAGGILRGIGRTIPAVLFNLVGYYVLALPCAWWLGFHLDQGLSGIWWGLCLGLGVISIALVLWIGKRGPKTASPVDGGST